MLLEKWQRSTKHLTPARLITLAIFVVGTGFVLLFQNCGQMNSVGIGREIPADSPFAKSKIVLSEKKLRRYERRHRGDTERKSSVGREDQ